MRAPARLFSARWLALPGLVLGALLLSGCTSWFGDDEPAPKPRPKAAYESETVMASNVVVAPRTSSDSSVPTTPVVNSAPVAQAQPAYTTTPVVQARPESTGITLADQRLQRIYDKQQRVLEQLEEKPENFTYAERDRLLENLLSEYQTYTYDNPNYVYGYIMYGKLLRQVGDRDGANVAFAKANQLDPSIAVVKQQLGNYLAEQGDYETALRYFASAAELEPGNAVYQYQIGELLYQNRKALLTVNNMPRAEFDAEMLKAFRKAAELDPSNRTFVMRFAEAQLDVESPNWGGTLYLWNELEKGAQTDLERDIIRLQKARVLIEMDRTGEAESILIVIQQPQLETSRQELLQRVKESNKEGEEVTK